MANLLSQSLLFRQKEENYGALECAGVLRLIIHPSFQQTYMCFAVVQVGV